MQTVGGDEWNLMQTVIVNNKTNTYSTLSMGKIQANVSLYIQMATYVIQAMLDPTPQRAARSTPPPRHQVEQHGVEDPARDLTQQSYKTTPATSRLI